MWWQSVRFGCNAKYGSLDESPWWCSGRTVLQAEHKGGLDARINGLHYCRHLIERCSAEQGRLLYCCLFQILCQWCHKWRQHEVTLSVPLSPDFRIFPSDELSKPSQAAKYSTITLDNNYSFYTKYYNIILFSSVLTAMIHKSQ